MTDQTSKFRLLAEHRVHTKGTQTICVSTCLNFFGIGLDKYSYTSSYTNRYAYESVLRRFGYSVRSKRTEILGSRKKFTITDVRTNLKKSAYSKSDMFLVVGIQAKSAHLMLFNGDGETVIDTAKGKRWKVERIVIVEKN